MCFSILQVPRCKIPTLNNFWRESFHSLSRADENRSSFKLLGSNIYGLESGQNKKCSLRPVCTKAEGRNKTTRQSKPSNIGHELLDGVVSKSDTFSVNKTEISQFQKSQYIDIQQKIAENKDLSSLVTIIVFDFETTGFSRLNDGIIEIALRDLEGGENSTFQTLVNPKRYIPNSHIHGITTRMVNRPEVPSMEELIPILLQYVRSRQKPGGIILLVAHNARSFDVPFFCKAFDRCSTEIPSNWFFLDSLSLARELMKSKGEKCSSSSLQALSERFEIPSMGKAHRAMSDVNVLSMLFPKLVFELKLSISDLIEKSFIASDSAKPKKK